MELINPIGKSLGGTVVNNLHSAHGGHLIYLHKFFKPAIQSDSY
jgi:hypothetical protein